MRSFLPACVTATAEFLGLEAWEGLGGPEKRGAVAERGPHGLNQH